MFVGWDRSRPAARGRHPRRGLPRPVRHGHRRHGAGPRAAHGPECRLVLVHPPRPRDQRAPPARPRVPVHGRRRWRTEGRRQTQLRAPRHSDRSARTGSTRAARQAGSALATRPTSRNSSAVSSRKPRRTSVRGQTRQAGSVRRRSAKAHVMSSPYPSRNAAGPRRTPARAATFCMIAKPCESRPASDTRMWNTAHRMKTPMRPRGVSSCLPSGRPCQAIVDRDPVRRLRWSCDDDDVGARLVECSQMAVEVAPVALRVWCRDDPRHCRGLCRG